MMESIAYIAFATLGIVFAAEPTVNCPVPISPTNGQVQLFSSGDTVKYACDPGYKLVGTRYAICRDNRWDPEPPICQQRDADLSMLQLSRAKPDGPKVTTTTRPLFKWDDDKEEETPVAEVNETAEADVQSDEARLRLLLFPERRLVQRIRSGSELEEEEQKRTTKTEKTTSTETPSVIYVRRPLSPSKLSSQQKALLRQYNRAALHLRSRDHAEEALRHAYWTEYLNPGHAAVAVHANVAGYPVAMTLSESQMAWINSLHPELRDRYLKDLYSMRAKEIEDGARAQAFLRRYEDVTHWLYDNPYYMRQPLSVLVEDPIATFDYSCYQTEEDGSVTRVRAPELPHAYIHRYDRRQNPNYPHNDYLAAEYRCHYGYTLADYRDKELYCSKKGWVGKLPVCLPRV